MPTGLGELNPFVRKGGEGDRPEEAATRTPHPKHTPGAPPVPDPLLTECRLLWLLVHGSPMHEGAAMNPLPSSNLGVGRPSERIRHTLMHPSLPGKAKLGCMGGR